ncbi:MAG: molybdenum ABC transporter ATP-binding protein [Betaproteobacteria bacterium]|nr:molybdenum ABC transporter ATP-binding protein [Betaproteobacteria bacterium]
MIDVRLEIRRGGFTLSAAFSTEAPVVALFGRSGSGKTTIVQALAGLVQPLSGHVRVGETTLYDSAGGTNLPPERRRIGYVFQDSLLFPHLTVRGNLAFGERLVAPAERYVDRKQIVDLLGLASLLDRSPSTLSGGERQRVAIGRALLANPRLLLLDEPLASLDGLRKAEILAYIEILRDELKIPIVYVSHSIEEVTRLADHMVLVSEGHTIAAGTVTEIMGRADLEPFTGRFQAGAVIETRVVSHDPDDGLTTLAFAGGTFVVPVVDALPGERVRVRVRARDVALALAPPADSSFLNVLEGVVTAVSARAGPIVDVTLAIGSNSIIARLSRRSCERLGIVPGKRAYALVKGVALDRHAVGFA